MTAPAVVSSLVVDCHDPATLASFWRSLLGGDIVDYPDAGVVVLRAPGITFDFIKNPDRKTTKNRWHIDLASEDVDGTINAALALGATGADDVCVTDRWVVLRDPDGNEFCVLRNMPADAPWAPPA